MFLKILILISGVVFVVLAVRASIKEDNSRFENLRDLSAKARDANDLTSLYQVRTELLYYTGRCHSATLKSYRAQILSYVDGRIDGLEAKIINAIHGIEL